MNLTLDPAFWLCEKLAFNNSMHVDKFNWPDFYLSKFSSNRLIVLDGAKVNSNRLKVLVGER